MKEKIVNHMKRTRIQQDVQSLEVTECKPEETSNNLIEGHEAIRISEIGNNGAGTCEKTESLWQFVMKQANDFENEGSNTCNKTSIAGNIVVSDDIQSCRVKKTNADSV